MNFCIFHTYHTCNSGVNFSDYSNVFYNVIENDCVDDYYDTGFDEYYILDYDFYEKYHDLREEECYLDGFCIDIDDKKRKSDADYIQYTLEILY